MTMRSRIGALLAAASLSLGIVGLALAIEVKDVHQNITVTWDAGGNAVITAESGEEFSDSNECDPPAQGWVTFHFVQSGPGVVANAPGNNLLDVDFEDEADANDVVEDSIQGNGSNVDWFVSVDASDGSVTMVTANSNVAGNDDTLRVSHICVGDAPETETEEPSFEQSEEVETEEPSEVVETEEPSEVVETEEPSEVVETEEPSFEQSQEVETEEPSEVVETEEPSEVVETEEPSEVVETEEPSFEQSQEGETDEPSFEQSFEGETDEPSLPDTTSLGGSKVASPADTAWLLVVALGMLLASIVVLTPARAKAPRR